MNQTWDGQPGDTTDTGNGTLIEIDHESGGNESESDYLYDRPDVRAICIIFYSIVFIACFFGNLIVIVVVTAHRRMRSITNFCLANLAFADLCVSIFCVYQNMYMYFMSSWVFGAFLCKMYFFITELSHTSSILILVVISIERYLAIVHPMRCKEWLTMTRLRVTIITVWTTAAIYSSPRLYFTNIRTIPLHGSNGQEETLCIPIRTLYDSETFDMVSLAVLFVLPLLVITVIYTRIAFALWESSKCQMETVCKVSAPSVVVHESCSSGDGGEIEYGDGSNCARKHVRKVTATPDAKHSCYNIMCCGFDSCLVQFSRRKSTRHVNFEENLDKDKPISSIEPIVLYRFQHKRGNSVPGIQKCTILQNGNADSSNSPNTKPISTIGHKSKTPTNPIVPKRMTLTRSGKYGTRALKSRRRIIKMLIIIVFAFAICNLPFHARKIWQYYGTGYSGGSMFSSIFTPLTFLIMYGNSGINPILYAFMSKKFRVCFLDLLKCKERRGWVARGPSVRSAHVVPAPSGAGVDLNRVGEAEHISKF